MFDWGEYLSLANELYSNNNINLSDRVRYRVAISRAYYAAFCIARNYIINELQENITPDRSVHSQVIEFFDLPGNKIYKSIFTSLDRLRDQRTDADYEDYYIPNKNDTEMALTVAQRIINNIDELKNPG